MSSDSQTCSLSIGDAGGGCRTDYSREAHEYRVLPMMVKVEQIAFPRRTVWMDKVEGAPRQANGVWTYTQCAEQEGAEVKQIRESGAFSLRERPVRSKPCSTPVVLGRSNPYDLLRNFIQGPERSSVR